MLNQKEQTQKFFDAINQDSQDKKDALQKKNEELLAQGLKKASDKAKAQADAMIERERLLGEQELNRTVSYNIRKVRTTLTDKRAKITLKVFEDAKSKLEAFTLTQDYEQFLKKSAERFASLFEQGEAIIYVCNKDKKFAPVIKASFGRDCKVLVDDNITLGGMRCTVEGSSVIADDTLETRLASQKEWFLENSGMSVIL